MYGARTEVEEESSHDRGVALLSIRVSSMPVSSASNAAKILQAATAIEQGYQLKNRISEIKLIEWTDRIAETSKKFVSESLNEQLSNIVE